MVITKRRNISFQETDVKTGGMTIKRDIAIFAREK